MSIYTNRATLSLLNMTREMYRKSIEIGRITKTCALLLMSGLSKQDVDSDIINRCLLSQKADGGFIGNTDTIWNCKLLEYYPEFREKRDIALQWLAQDNGTELGFGRSKRDMHRIPVTGLALYLLPELRCAETMNWLSDLWMSERNSLTYKAAYTLLAFRQCGYDSKQKKLIRETVDWLISQQQESGGFAPWHDHPVGANVYCTAVAMLGIMSDSERRHAEVIAKAYTYLCSTQLKSGIWPYHEIEDGSAWGLYAMTQAETYLEDRE